MIFIVNGATPRARITGEAAIALSQHGTVAPITLHHRVDFAASMVDGRTVGEVVAKSQSAKEVRDLWLYIQDRLSRLTGDVKLLPDVRPTHFATGALSSLSDERPPPALEPEFAPEDMPPPLLPERRYAPERRISNVTPFGGVDRRAHPFGRRAAERP